MLVLAIFGSESRIVPDVREEVFKQELKEEKVRQPVLFIAGAKDPLIGGANTEQLTALMAGGTNDLRGVKMFPGGGHWVSQEFPNETNAAILEFIKGLK